MKIFFLAVTVLVTVAWVTSTETKSQDQQTEEQRQLTTNQMLMRDKLVQMNQVLEGITLDKFDQVEESARVLGMISRATTWHVVEPTPQYERLSKNFQEQVADLQRHAKERNVEAATLDLVRMNITCAQCHQHMREHGAGE